MPSVAQAVLASWSFPPWATVLNLFAAVVYFRGWLELHPALPGRFPAWRLTAFLSGLATLELALASPIDTFDPFFLTDHMIQHLFLMMIVPPLILLGNPYLALLRGMPRWAARRVLGPLLNWPPLGRFGRGLVHPAVGFLALALANFGWHVPAAYELALRSPGWHDCEHVCFFVASILYWWPVVRPWPSRGRSISWFLPVYLALGDIVNSILSAFLAFSGRVLYPWYASVPRLGGFSAQDDQVASGAVMWVIGSLAFLIPAVIITVRLLSPAAPATHPERHGARPGPSQFRRIFLPALALLLPLAALAFAWLAPDTVDTDGDIVRLQGISGPFQITLFTAPGAFDSGPAEASILVQGRDSGEVILDAAVTLAVQPASGRPGETVSATRGQSTNKLLEAATMNLTGPGPWKWRVAVERGGEHGALSGILDAASRGGAPAPAEP